MDSCPIDAENDDDDWDGDEKDLPLFDQETLTIRFLDEVDLKDEESRFTRLPFQRDSLCDFKTTVVLHAAVHIGEGKWLPQSWAAGPVLGVEPEVEDELYHLSDALDDSFAGFLHCHLSASLFYIFSEFKLWFAKRVTFLSLRISERL